MPSLDARIMFVSSDLPQGCVTSVKSVSLARAAAAQPTFSELAPHGLVRIDKGLHSFNIISACVFMLWMGASEAQASKWLSLTQYNSTIGLQAFWHFAWIDSDGICFSRLRMPSVKLGLVRRCLRVRSATQRFLSCKIILPLGLGRPIVQAANAVCYL